MRVCWLIVIVISFVAVAYTIIAIIASRRYFTDEHWNETKFDLCLLHAQIGSIICGICSPLNIIFYALI